VIEGLRARLRGLLPVRPLGGLPARVKEAAQGAALLADGLAGGHHQALVRRMRIGEAQGTVLDHLHLISTATARRRLALEGDG
jgi:predicted butyrate kinase (DUF1464 family)